MEYRDFIVGEKFYDLGYKYFPQNTQDFNPFECTLPTIWNKNVCHITEKIDEPIIVYCHIHHVERLFSEMVVDNPIILVTHNSDHSLDDKLFSMRPKNIIKWYSQNVMVEDPIVESIPIGLENERWFPKIQKKNKILNMVSRIKKYKNLMYMNHSVRTNPTQRGLPYQLFGNKNWSTSVRGTNGQNFESYIDNIYNHKFVLCPNGNGVDTHRLWETLYLKSIPIVTSSVNTKFYEDLPILIVNNWGEVNQGLLENFFEVVSKKVDSEEYNLNKLKVDYWLNKIKNEITNYDKSI